MDEWYDGSQICNTNTCSVKPEVELATGKYIWRVQTWSAQAEGPWSEAMEFSVQ
jgi:hypothetical protein